MKNTFSIFTTFILLITCFSCEEDSSTVSKVIFTFKQAYYTPSDEVKYFIVASDPSGNVIDWRELKEELDVSLFSDEPIDKFTYSIINYYPLDNEVWIRSFYNIEAGTILNEYLPEEVTKQVRFVCNLDNVYQLNVANYSFYIDQTEEYFSDMDLWYDYTYAIAYSRNENEINFTHYKFFPNLINRNDGLDIDLDITTDLQPLQIFTVNENIYYNELILKVDAADRRTWVYLPEDINLNGDNSFDIHFPGNSLGSFGSKTSIRTNNGEIENYSVNEMYNTSVNNWTASINFMPEQIEVESSSEADYAFFNVSNWIDEESYTYFWRFYIPSGNQTINPIIFPPSLLEEVPTLAQIVITENNLTNLYLRKWENFESMTKQFINDDDLPFYEFSANNQIRYFDLNTNSTKNNKYYNRKLFLDTEKATKIRTTDNFKLKAMSKEESRSLN